MVYRFSRRWSILVLQALLSGVCAAPVAQAEDWQPIVADDLKETTEPGAPGAAAAILYRQVDRNDDGSTEYVYERIKILKEEGRKYADIEIPYVHNAGGIRSIAGRTIQPDGSIVNFDGKVFDKTIVRMHEGKMQAKTFALPAVQVGSIVEYRYTRFLEEGFVFDSHWVLSEDLYTRVAKFSLRPSREFTLTWAAPRGLPGNTQLPSLIGGMIRLEVHDIPAFVVEDDMPPEQELRYHIDFIYSTGEMDKEEDAFWKRYTRDRYKTVESFVDEHRAMEAALQQIVAPGDSDDIKLHKIYDRCQKLRNTDYEAQKTDQESKRDDVEGAHNVADVWKRGYGNGFQITWLFLALVRTAGYSADPVLVSTRDRYLFRPHSRNTAQLNTNVVMVRFGGNSVYMDPGAQFVPFGTLPWEETAVVGRLLNKDGGTWVSTSSLPASESRVLRQAKFTLDDQGTLEGNLTVTYSGQAALWRRTTERLDDAVDRKKFLEDDVKDWIPSGSEVSLKHAPDWDSSDPAMAAEFTVRVPGWAQALGKRLLLPLGVFSGLEKHKAETAVRVQPLYFRYPYVSEDKIAIDLPQHWVATNKPVSRQEDLGALTYDQAAAAMGTTINVHRTLLFNTLTIPQDRYSFVHEFFQKVRAGDEEQIVLVRESPTSH